jgi:hypothetical protein
MDSDESLHQRASGGIATATVAAPAPALSTPPAIAADARTWSPWHRIGFRFVCAYFVLYLLPFPLGQGLPFSGAISQAFSWLWEALAGWVGRVLLQLQMPDTVAVSGSGDKLYDYVWNFTVLLLAVLITVVWSARTRRREHAQLREWVRLYVRLGLGAVAISYGAYKVIKSQFPYPSLDRLAQPFGESSPMGLLWSFIGYSPAYNVFTGLGELLGGVLLFFRRTALLGALLLISVLANIVILNFTYDVPVKLYSSNLLLMAIWIAAFDARRLLNLLVLNRAALPDPVPPLLASRGKRSVLQSAILLILGVTLWQTLSNSHSARTTYGDASPKPPLYGLYDTQEFVRNGSVHPPLLTDTLRWRRASFTRRGFLTIRLMNDSLRFFRVRVDTMAHTALLLLPSDSTQRMTLFYQVPDPDRLVLTGEFGGDSIRATFTRRDESDFLLFNRGFHWIQEFPFNR